MLLLQAGVLQLELELLEVIGQKLFQGVQEMVTPGPGHGVDQKRLEAVVLLLREKTTVCLGARRVEDAACEITEKAQEMLCVLVGTETKAVTVSLLACVLFLQESEAFPGRRAQCLVSYVVVLHASSR